ncbi:MAG: ATP-binding cassette domain-containing protein [Acidimicrobiales bacterium]|nr:ATP-binding cassette domain-containing protein [Acidimicrobiales bacterium]
MKIPVQYLILGLGLGGIYALSALGLVLVYRASGVINFANGAIGMVGTYLFYELHAKNGWSFAAAIVPSLIASAVIGYLAQVLFMSRLRNASPLVRLLATIGLLISLQSAMALRYPAQLLVLKSSLPTKGLHILGVVVGEDHILIFVIALVLAGALGAVYKFTRFGLATTAVSDDMIAAESLGYSANLIGAFNWAIASALSALGGILLAPIIGLTVGELTTLLVPALAAAVLGSMVSFPVTVGAALAIGIVQSEMSWYVKTGGWSQVVPFVAIVVVLAMRGTTIPGRGFQVQKLPRVSSGRIKPGNVIVAVGAGLALIELWPIAWVNGTAVTLAIAMLLLSFVVLTGYAGQLSLAQFALAGIGAFVAGRLIAAHHVPFPLDLLAGFVAAAPVGFLVGLPAVRTRGSNLAIATLGLSVAVEALVFDSYSWTGKSNGTNIGSPKFFGINLSAITHPRTYAVFTLILVTLVGMCVANLRRGRTGRRLLAIRANERAAAALGLRVASLKLYAFVLGSMIAALGGILLAFRNTSIVYSDFTATTSINLVGQAIVGGVGYVSGPVFGGTLQPASLGTNIGNLVFGQRVQEYLPLVSGILLIIILIRSPDGMASHSAHNVGKLIRLLARLLPSQLRRHPPQEVGTAAAPGGVTYSSGPREHKALEVRGLSVTYGGVRALDGVSLEVRPGSVVGLIGPNGAGKTTLIDAVTGFTHVTSGDILLDGMSLRGVPPRIRADKGVGRSFQSLELFEDMTVLENILVATETYSPVSYARDLFAPGTPVVSPVANAVIDEFKLRGDLQRIPSELPYGKRRLVGIARAIAAEPSILLLDEPAAGLGDSERDELVALIRAMSEERGIGILLVEHDVDLVMRACDRVTVLDFGRVIAQGSAAEVRSNPAVIEAYLGGGAEREPHVAQRDTEGHSNNERIGVAVDGPDQ